MLEDYICRQDLLAELSAGCMPIDEKGVSGLTGDNDCIRDYINNAPMVDVAEVKHGEWVGTDGDNGDYESGHSAWIEFHCSCCGYEMSLETGEYGWGYDEEMKIPFDYCPHCGADMRGNK